MSARLRRDFTMIEMVMVLLIVAVVMTLAAASLTGPDSGADALEAHLEKLTELLQSCRTAALRTGHEQQLLYQANIEFMKKLNDNGFPYTYMETDGGHIWKNWRIYLSEFVPLLFK